ncbi:hypothetical protein E2C01_059722 [Portunus trituberculatus]|uniref:Uncharacterized protein n=1 Tax=Portunus trituberculatus TaxID=210409 RepID=A0A5B7H9V0_PORTR|nr:hypothetical protein [Portunus trituberculatus]
MSAMKSFVNPGCVPLNCYSPTPYYTGDNTSSLLKLTDNDTSLAGVSAERRRSGGVLVAREMAREDAT